MYPQTVYINFKKKYITTSWAFGKYFNRKIIFLY